MTAGRYDRLIVEQGATFELPLDLERPVDTPWDLTSVTCYAQLRVSFGAVSAALDFDVVMRSATGGLVTLYAAASATADLPTGDIPQGFYPAVWDFEIHEGATANPTVTRVLEGRARIHPEATR